MKVKGGDAGVITEDSYRGLLRAQFTIAYWYIDRADQSTAATRPYYLDQARLAHEIIRQVLPHVELRAATRERLREELTILRRKLEISERADSE